MNNPSVVIICRSKQVTVDIKKTSLPGLLAWGSHIKQTCIKRQITNDSNIHEIKARIESNVRLPEWIGNHRFGLFDLLNYVNNGYKYVYNPATNSEFFDPIGIPSSTSLHLYDYLVKNRYHPINIDNFNTDPDRLKEAVSNKPLAVVISATFLVPSQIKSIIRYIHKINRNIPIIIGSSYILTRLDSNQKLLPEYEALLSRNVYMVLDEYGLDILHALLQRIKQRESIENISNMVYSDNGTIVYTDKKVHDYDINSDYPAWANIAAQAKNVAFIRSSRGCPYKCKFCSFPKANIKFRHRSVESIREEMKEIHSIGIKNIAFTDDNFAITPKRITEICRMMLKEKFDFNWFAGIRANSITEDNAKLLEATGCKVLCVGLESGDDRVLKLINKKTTATSNMKCLEILDKHNIVAYGSFIVGFPGETMESYRTTINWINSSPLRLYKVFLFYLFPGSIIFDEQAEHNITFLGDSYHHSLWKTPTMDALNASELVREFILSIEKAVLIYNYSAMYAFFPFLSKGYTIDESLEFFRIRTELIKSELSNHSFHSRRKFRKEKYKELAQLIKN
jgi:anaerobic magnesium-protoporphyrin IX monomethyl ester cyclase